MEQKTPDIDCPGADPIAATIAFWEAYAGVAVSPEDAREMVENLTGFFQLLDQWDRGLEQQPDGRD